MIKHSNIKQLKENITKLAAHGIKTVLKNLIIGFVIINDIHKA